MKKYLVLVILTVLSLQMKSQNQIMSKDKIILKDGSVIYGKLLDYSSSKIVKFELFNNSILTIPDSNILSLQTNFNYDEEPDSKSKGLYSYLCFKVLPGDGNYSFNRWYGYQNPGMGIGAEYTIGYKFSQFLYTGVGLGIETYNTYEKATFYPLYIDMMAMFKKSKTTPFLRLQFGYSPVTTHKDDNSPNNYNQITNAEGGLTYNPAFGIKFGNNKNFIYTLDLNYKFQKATFDYRQNPLITITKDIEYKRFSFRFGVLF